MRGQVMQIPLLFGDGRDPVDGDYSTNMPVNMIPVMRPVKGADGYMRMFPGTKKKADVSGPSRGVNWNTVKQLPYRVMGTTLYLNGADQGTVSGSDRVSMSHSRNSVAVVSSGAMTQYYYSGEEKLFSNWPTGGGPTPNPQYDWGQIGDVVWHRGRYVFSTVGTDTFWCSDLEDESHPDKIAPAYRAESMPDGIKAMKVAHDYVLAFGDSTIESFSLTGSSDQIYALQSSYTANVGIAGRDCVCEYSNGFAFITSPSCGIVTIGVMGVGSGAWQDIASNQVKKILASYPVSALINARCEPLTFRSFNLLIVHLPDHTLVFESNASSAMGVPCWSIITTGITGTNHHRSIDFINEGNSITCGDRTAGIWGELDESSMAQYGEDQEFILFTSSVPTENAMINDLEIDSNSGSDSVVSRLWVSCSEDGMNWGMERLIDYSSPQKWLQRVLLRKIGRVRTSIAFKIRGVGASPATLARARIRVS